MPPSASSSRAVALAVFVTVLWSSSWVLIRIGLGPGLRPIGFASLRYLIAAAVLALLCLATARSRRSLTMMTPRQWAELFVLGLTFYALAQGAQFVAIASQPAASSSLVLSLTPMIVGLIATLSLGEPPGLRLWLGAGIIALGAALYTVGELGFTFVGLIAAIVGLGANVAGAIMGRAINRRHDVAPLTVTAVSMGVGAVTLFLAAILTEGTPTPDAGQWVIVLWLAVVNTALAFTLWNRSLRVINATQSSMINNSMLVQIAVLAWLFLGERLSLIEWLGVALVTAGVLLASIPPVPTLWHRGRRPAPGH